MSLPVHRPRSSCFFWTARLLFAGGLVCVAPAAKASGWALPAWSGEITGQAFPLGEGGLRLAWTFTPRTTGEAAREIVLRAENDATHLRILVTLDAATGDGTWKIEEGRIDVGPWLVALAPQLGQKMAGLTAEGAITLIGKGAIHGGRPTGHIRIEWLDGTVSNTGQGWSLAGVTIKAEADVETLPDGAVPVELTVKTITTSRLGASNLSASAVLNGTRSAAVAAARVEIAGGEVVVDPFVVPLAEPAVHLKLHMTKVGLQDIVALVPAALADASGCIDGEVELGWSEAGGIELGNGGLSVRDDESNSIRLMPKPGFLTSSMQARFVLLPQWMGPVARWFGFANPAYGSLRSVELGQSDLRICSLSAHVTPEGDGRGRSASVEIVTETDPASGRTDKIIFTINVAGPLEQVLRLGMREHISVGGR